MCNRPSRSLKSTVSALMRFSSVRYLSRSSRMVSRETRFLRSSFALRLRSSSSSYDNARKLRSSLDMDVVQSPLRWTVMISLNQLREIEGVEIVGFNTLLGTITLERLLWNNEG